MRLTEPLDDLFRGRSHIRVLRALDGLTEGVAVSARELARRAGLSHPTASSVVASLREQGLVRVRHVPRADLFEFNRQHALAARLTELFAWERHLREELRDSLRAEITRRRLPITSAFLFGSAVRGEMRTSSDIDLAVACRPGKEQEVEVDMQEVADVIRERFGTRLNVIVGTGPVERLLASQQPNQRLWRRIIAQGISLAESGSR